MPKCSECGFLATRNKESRELLEMEYDFRYPNDSITVGNMLKVYDYPVCFKRKVDLQAEIDRSDASISKIALSITNTIERDRPCGSFTDWFQGLTPKEHQEMIDREWERQFQASREDADRKWKERQDKRLVFIAGAFTILGAVIGSLIAIFS